MKQGYVKYSDERNRHFSIKTSICLQNGQKSVSKSAVFPEGSRHLEHMFESQEKLKAYYSDVEICRAWKNGVELEFKYIEGELLLNRYAAAVKKGDIGEYERLLHYHKNIICGNENNRCTFEKNEDFEEWFGDAGAYEGVRGMKYSNFDAIAGNIIIRDNNPVFIDYEWTMDFVMPEELVVYHCIYDGYLHHPDFEQFYSFERVLKLLGITVEQQVLEESYKHFFNYVVSEKDGRSYGKDKYMCLKDVQKTNHILKEWQHCAEEWKKASEANAQLSEDLAHARKEWQNCAGEWKNAVEANANLEQELAHARQEWENCAGEWKHAVEIVDLLNKDYQELQDRYNAVVNSRWWKLHDRIHGVSRPDTKQ